MSDRIVLTNMRFRAVTAATTGSARPSRSRWTSSWTWTSSRPGRRRPDPVRRLRVGLRGVRAIVESTSYRLLEAIAEAISHELLADFDVDEVGVRVRKPAVELGGP